MIGKDLQISAKHAFADRMYIRWIGGLLPAKY